MIFLWYNIIKKWRDKIHFKNERISSERLVKKEMKFKTTNKQLRESGKPIYFIPFNMKAPAEEPVAYTCGLYGWNFDVYQTSKAIFCYGYRPIGIPMTDEMKERYADGECLENLTKEEI